MKVELVSQKPPTVFVTLRGSEGSIETLGVVDTGATAMLIAPDIAEHLGYDLSEAPTFPVVTVNGVIQAPKITLDEVRVGRCRVRRPEAVCHDMSDGGLSVLIGLSFLQHFQMSLDFHENCLVLKRYS